MLGGNRCAAMRLLSAAARASQANAAALRSQN